MKICSKFIEIALRHRCSPVNLLHIFRIPEDTYLSLLFLERHLTFLVLTDPSNKVSLRLLYWSKFGVCIIYELLHVWTQVDMISKSKSILNDNLWQGRRCYFFNARICHLLDIMPMLHLLIKRINLCWKRNHLTMRWSCPNRDLYVQSQQQKHQNNVWNIFKGNNKDTRRMSLTSFWCLSCKLWTSLAMRSLVVRDLRSKTKGSRFESSY